MAEVNLKNLQYKRSDQGNEEDGSHGSRIEQRITLYEILVQKGANLSRNERQGNDVAHTLLTNLVLHLGE